MIKYIQKRWATVKPFYFPKYFIYDLLILITIILSIVLIKSL